MKAFVYPVLRRFGLILPAQALTPTDSLGSVTSDGGLTLSTGGEHSCPAISPKRISAKRIAPRIPALPQVAKSPSILRLDTNYTG